MYVLRSVQPNKRSFCDQSASFIPYLLTSARERYIMGMICQTMLSNKKVIEQQQGFQRILEGAVCLPFEGKASWHYRRRELDSIDKLDNTWAFDACRLYAGRGTYGSKQVCFGLLGWCERNLSPSQAVMDLQLSFKSNTIIPSTSPEQKRVCQRSVGWGMAGQVISNTLGMIVAVELQIGTLLWTLRRCSQRWKMSVLLEDPPNLHICK